MKKITQKTFALLLAAATICGNGAAAPLSYTASKFSANAAESTTADEYIKSQNEILFGKNSSVEFSLNICESNGNVSLDVKAQLWDYDDGFFVKRCELWDESKIYIDIYDSETNELLISSKSHCDSDGNIFPQTIYTSTGCEWHQYIEYDGSEKPLSLKDRSLSVDIGFEDKNIGGLISKSYTPFININSDRKALADAKPMFINYSSNFAWNDFERLTVYYDNGYVIESPRYTYSSQEAYDIIKSDEWYDFANDLKKEAFEDSKAIVGSEENAEIVRILDKDTYTASLDIAGQADRLKDCGMTKNVKIGFDMGSSRFYLIYDDDKNNHKAVLLNEYGGDAAHINDIEVVSFLRATQLSPLHSDRVYNGFTGIVGDINEDEICSDDDCLIADRWILGDKENSKDFSFNSDFDVFELCALRNDYNYVDRQIADAVTISAPVYDDAKLAADSQKSTFTVQCRLGGSYVQRNRENLKLMLCDAETDKLVSAKFTPSEYSSETFECEFIPDKFEVGDHNYYVLIKCWGEDENINKKSDIINAKIISREEMENAKPIMAYSYQNGAWTWNEYLSVIYDNGVVLTKEYKFIEPEDTFDYALEGDIAETCESLKSLGHPSDCISEEKLSLAKDFLKDVSKYKDIPMTEERVMMMDGGYGSLYALYTDENGKMNKLQLLADETTYQIIDSPEVMEFIDKFYDKNLF